MSIPEDIHGDLEKGAARLVAEYRERLCKDALSLCGDAVEAEDLAFRTFDRAIRRIDTFRGESSFYGWMKAILHNLYISSVRTKSANGTVLGEVDGETPESSENPTSEERLLAASDAEVVRQAIESLSPDLKETILLHYFMDQPVAKIAKLLMVPEGTVKFRLHYARRVLAELLSKQLKRPIVRIALLALGLGTFAGVVSYMGGQPSSATTAHEDTRPSDTGTYERKASDIFDINEQGGKNMIMARKVASLVGASVLTVTAPAQKLMSESTFIFLKPETSSFWNTATNNVMSLPIDYPAGASSATLTVEGDGYSQTYTDLRDTSFELQLPRPDLPELENVYNLTLTFDNGVVRRAKLGLIQGLAPQGAGSTRCLAPANGTVWNKVRRRAVLPIPYGTTAFSVTVNGQQWINETELDGAQGWYALGGINRGDNVSLSFTTNSVNCLANLLGKGNGYFVVNFK